MNMEYRTLKSQGYDLLAGVSKGLVTLSVGIIAGLVSLIKLSGFEFSAIYLAKAALIACALSIVTAMLLQVSIASFMLGEKSRIPSNPKLYYAISWFLFGFAGCSSGIFLIINI